jgi:hypothetical protein
MKGCGKVIWTKAGGSALILIDASDAMAQMCDLNVMTANPAWPSVGIAFFQIRSPLPSLFTRIV